MQESLGQEELPYKGKATHPSILVWRIPLTDEHCGLQSMVSQSWTQLSN